MGAQEQIVGAMESACEEGSNLPDLVEALRFGGAKVIAVARREMGQST